MTKDELIARLGKYEWKDVEFKKAQQGVPKNAYETVSAFANTAGGYLVFGVQDADGSFEIVGVIEFDKVQNDFLSSLRSSDKLNHAINVQEDVVEHDGKTLLVFYVPEARRREKPVYLDGDIRKSYIRRGAGDERCTQTEIERFLRDAADSTYDGELLDYLDATNFFDTQSVAWYRKLFQEKQGNRHANLSDIEFLTEWGFVIEVKDTLVPTRAAVLLFGKGRYVHQILPRGIVDYQRIDTPFTEWSPERRWHDRIVVEDNIIQAWQTLVEKYLRLADRPFSIDSATLRRHDDPPDYISFREAAINILIHQDYSDHKRKPVIKIFTDQTLFWNPGDAFATVDQLLEPTEKEVRNPAIVNAFRRIGLSDQAGTGVRSIVSNWRQLGYVPPVIRSDKAEKTFQIILHKALLLTERQSLFQSQLGVSLSDEEAAVFAYACRSDSITMTAAKTVIGQRNREVRRVLDRLVTMALLRPVEEGVLWDVVEHHKDRFRRTDQVADQAGSWNGDLVTDQVGSPKASLVTDQVGSPEVSLVTPLLTNLTDHQRKIIKLCEVPRKQADLMREIGLKHRTFFRQNHLEPLIHAKLICMTHPDESNHPDQAYVVTEAGRGLLSARKKATDEEANE